MIGRLIRALIGALALLALRAPEAALAWELRTGDDGVRFHGALSATETGGLTLSCIGPSARRLSMADAGEGVTAPTAPGALRVRIRPELVGPPAPGERERGDVVLAAGGAGFRIARLGWDNAAGTWAADLPATDPLFAAMTASPRLEIRSRAGTVGFPAAPFEDGFTRLRGFCRAMFAALGQGWDSQAVGAGEGPRARAEQAIEAGCGGLAAREPGYLLTAEIDGDGREDAVLDWQAIECLADTPRPFCGAGQCSADIFLSTRPGPPLTVLARTLTLQPLSNGLTGLRVGQSTDACGARPAGPGCEAVLYWTGTGIARLD